VSAARSIGVLVLVVSGMLLGAAPSALAETAWVRGEVRLNVRTGPGTQFRIIGLVSTGDEVDVVERGEDWTKIRVTDDDGEVKLGWIPEGYLRPDPPPTIRLSRAEDQVAALRGELDSLREETSQLRSDNQILTTQEGEQQSRIKQLTMENMELRAGARVAARARPPRRGTEPPGGTSVAARASFRRVPGERLARAGTPRSSTRDRPSPRRPSTR